MTYRIGLALALLLAPPLRAADCAPEPMLRVVSAVAFDDADSFAAQPKTLYRSGLRLGRMEEVPDREAGLHLLIVVNEPDVWMVNLAENTGQHIVDPGPSLVFRAPVLNPNDFPDWVGLEFGCEVRFFRDAEADRIVLGPDGRVRYSLTRAGTEVDLYTDSSGTPLKLEVTGENGFVLSYLEYEILDLDPALFQKPEGVTYEEAGS